LAMERLYKDGHALSNKIITKTRSRWRVFLKKRLLNFDRPGGI